MIEINEFRRNQSRFPRAELESYNGQYVAWSPDGTRILAAHADLAQVDAMLIAAGYDPGEILVNRVAIPEEVSWSGWCVCEEVQPSNPLLSWAGRADPNDPNERAYLDELTRLRQDDLTRTLQGLDKDGANSSLTPTN